jgi:hypothetical protein
MDAIPQADRIQMKQLSDQVQDLRAKENRAKSSEQIQAIRNKSAAAQQKLNGLRDKYGVDEYGRPKEAAPAKEAAPKQKSAPSEKVSKTPTYDGMGEEDKGWIDAYAEGIGHQPQILREATMEELKKYGDQGTPLKERIAMEHVASQNRGPREPGEEDEHPAGGSTAEANRAERRNYDTKRLSRPRRSGQEF